MFLAKVLDFLWVFFILFYFIFIFMYLILGYLVTTEIRFFALKSKKEKGTG